MGDGGMGWLLTMGWLLLGAYLLVLLAVSAVMTLLEAFKSKVHHAAAWLEETHFAHIRR